MATKCDNPESVRQINSEELAAACQSCVSDFKTSASKPENSRNALFRLLKVLVTNRQGMLNNPGLLICTRETLDSLDRPRGPR